MPHLQRRHHRRFRKVRARSLSLVESLVSMLIVAGLVVTSLDLLGATATAGAVMSRHAQAQLLAQGLMSEILETAYLEPSGVNVTFGPEIGEVNLLTGSRALFDDVDDYEGWKASPPKRRDGTDLPNHEGWERKVQVVLVQPTNLATPSFLDQGVKRITVWVCWNETSCNQNNALATLVAVRTNTPISESNIFSGKPPGGGAQAN